MKTIYKYPIQVTVEQTIRLPMEAVILDIQDQMGTLQMWAMVNPDAAKTNRKFRIYGTGHKIEEDEYLVYIKSIQQGQYIWHIFEVIGQ